MLIGLLRVAWRTALIPWAAPWSRRWRRRRSDALAATPVEWFAGRGNSGEEGVTNRGGPMEIVEQKIDCKLVAKGQVLDVLLHLVEVRYSDRIVFWNGVTQV